MLTLRTNFETVTESLIHVALELPLRKFIANRPYTARKNHMTTPTFHQTLTHHATNHFTTHPLTNLHWRGILGQGTKHVMIDITRTHTHYRATIKLTTIKTEILQDSL